MVYGTLKELRKIYPFIEYKVVLAYLTKRKSDYYTVEPADTLFPDELLKTPLKFAVSKRNEIMLKLADTVVMYACMPGNTWNLKAAAEDKGKRIINLYNANRKQKTGAENSAPKELLKDMSLRAPQGARQSVFPFKGITDSFALCAQNGISFVIAKPCKLLWQSVFPAPCHCEGL